MLIYRMRKSPVDFKMPQRGRLLGPTARNQGIDNVTIGVDGASTTSILTADNNHFFEMLLVRRTPGDATTGISLNTVIISSQLMANPLAMS